MKGFYKYDITRDNWQTALVNIRDQGGFVFDSVQLISSENKSKMIMARDLVFESVHLASAPVKESECRFT